jgi:hypothetical protein
MAAESLNLVGDGGEIDFIEDLESAFGVALAADDAAHWRTLGDVVRTFEMRLDPVGGEAQAFAIQRAFYLIRGAIGGGRRIRPSTPLTSIGERPRDLAPRIAEATRLTVPVLRGSPAGNAAELVLLLGIGGLTVGAASGSTLGMAISGAGAGAALLWIAFFEPYRFPAEVETVGDLARSVAALNFAALHGAGAGRGIGAWDVVAAVAAEHASGPAEMGPETLLFPRR